MLLDDVFWMMIVSDAKDIFDALKKQEIKIRQ